MNKNARIELLQAFYQRHGLALSWGDVILLQRIASQYQTNGIGLCNVPDYKDRRDKLHDRLKSILMCRGVSPGDIDDGVDPRGYCLKIKCPDGFIVQPHQFN
jgi:hypothetical protein